jgi:3-dehydroquinate synthetase
VITIELAAAGGVAPYYLVTGGIERAGELLDPQISGRRRFVVSDDTVARLYGGALADRVDAPLLAVAPGEEHKSLASAENITRWLLSLGAERRDVVIAIGGGVVTDLAGFAASVTLRGLRWVAVPTTLLGMVDAAVGGKTGVDLDVGKNLIGTFWQPAAVLADPAALATLEPRQLRSGLVEVVKAAIIRPASLPAVLDRCGAAVASGALGDAEPLIAEAVRIKAEIVAGDEREAGQRAALNLGHTVGHAVEAATGYRRFVHGEAVAWGLLVALALAVRRRAITSDEARAWARRLASVASFPPVADLGWETLRTFITRDKKAAGGRVGWVLPRSGGVDVGVAVGDDEARDAWLAVRDAGRAEGVVQLF